MPQHIRDISEGIISDTNEFSSMQTFLIAIALCRGYLYGEYFLFQKEYQTGKGYNPFDWPIDKILHAMEPTDAKNLTGDHNMAEHVDPFFPILISESVALSGDFEAHNTPEVAEKSQQMMMFGLLARFAEIRLENQKDGGDQFDKINEVVALQPNVMGIGINFNKLPRFQLHTPS